MMDDKVGGLFWTDILSIKWEKKFQKGLLKWRYS